MVSLEKRRRAGQRYRVVYQIDEEHLRVLVYLVGIRKEGSRQDVYALALRLVRRGLLLEERHMGALRETEKITMVDARRELTRLPERLEARPATMAVTRRGKPVLAIT